MITLKKVLHKCICCFMGPRSERGRGGVRTSGVVGAMTRKSANRKIGEEALKFLDKHRLDPTPFNYGFAYLYFTGVSGSLRKAVDEITDGGIRIVQRDVEELMGSTSDVAGTGPSAESDERSAELRKQALLFADLTARTLHDTANFNRDLSSSMDQVNEGHELGSVVRAMIDRTTQVESKLAEARLEAERLRQDLEVAKGDAMRDGLTNLPNRRAMDQKIAQAFQERNAVTLAFCDIDHFKSINDRFGHGVGDRVLKVVAETLNEALWPREVARFGGEEFVVLFADETPQTAFAMIEKARQAVAARQFRVRETDAPLGQVTFSAGIARSSTSAEQALADADKALYEAKNSGRNRTICKA